MTTDATELKAETLAPSKDPAKFTLCFHDNTFVVKRDGGVQRVFGRALSQKLAPSAEFEAFLKDRRRAAGDT